MFDLLQSRGGGEFVPIRQVALNVLEKIEAASKSNSTVTGIPTGFIDLDYRTSGFQPSDFILIAARPSMGKTAFVLNVVEHVAVKKGLPCMVFSLEMSKEQLVNRMLSMESNVDSQKLRTGTLTDSDWDAVVEGIGTIGSSKLIIDDTPGISISELRSKCRKVKLEYGLSLVIIDYLQLMSGSGKSGENRQQEISEISRSLKALARELNAPVICPVAAFPCLRDTYRTTARCFRICVSLVRLSRMPMWLCFCTVMIITTRIRIRRISRR